MKNGIEQNIAKIALFGTIALLSFGIYAFYSGSEYLEDGQTIVLLMFFIACGAFYILMRARTLAFSAIAGLLALVLTFVMFAKSDWRKEYVESMNGDLPFYLEEHIDQYPTWEEQIWINLSGAPNWVDFNNQCALPYLRGRNVRPQCTSFAFIEKEYGLDMKSELRKHFKKMKRTAQRIEKGQIKNTRQYRKCLLDKTCTIVPMLPKGVEAEDISQDSSEFIDVRKAFWSIMNDKDITPEVCEFMRLCDLLIKLDVVDPRRMNIN